MTEVWRKIPGRWSAYEVSDEGRVRTPAGRILKATVQPRGYHAITFRDDQGRQTVRVHVLVAAAFIGPRPTGHQVRHLDGVCGHNQLRNLAYGTPAQNSADAVAHGTTGRGERNSNARLTDREASAALALAGRVTQADLAVVFGCSFKLINAVQRRKTYVYITAAPLTDAVAILEERSGRALSSFPTLAHATSGEATAKKLTWKAVDAIRADARSQTEIAQDHGITQSLVSQIKRGVAWRPELDPRTRSAA